MRAKLLFIHSCEVVYSDIGCETNEVIDDKRR